MKGSSDSKFRLDSIYATANSNSNGTRQYIASMVYRMEADGRNYERKLLHHLQQHRNEKACDDTFHDGTEKQFESKTFDIIVSHYSSNKSNKSEENATNFNCNSTEMAGGRKRCKWFSSVIKLFQKFEKDGRTIESRGKRSRKHFLQALEDEPFADEAKPYHKNRRNSLSREDAETHGPSSFVVTDILRQLEKEGRHREKQLSIRAKVVTGTLTGVFYHPVAA